MDLNCDLGEGGAHDEAIMDYISSVNIACGLHAGNATLMRKTVELALQKGKAIGAHPGYPDAANFGRKPMQMSAEEIHDIILYQTGALNAIVEAVGGKLHHVKPHGALYNMSAADPIIARAIAKAIAQFDDQLVLYGLAGSYSIEAAHEYGLKTAAEAFADRRYEKGGKLTPRSNPEAIITNTQEACEQAMAIALKGEINTREGERMQLKAGTICIHGDHPQSLSFARSLNSMFRSYNIIIEAI